jgi:hypothetical protein
MASNINPYNIDGTFPVAGQDNSSQGFRDNFTNIKNNFLFAQNEINDLQSKSIVASALNGQTVNNDMAGTIIRRPQLASWTQTLLDNGVISSSLALDFDQANFQKITSGSSFSLSFINFPVGTGTGSIGYGSMRVWVVITNIAHTMTIPSNVTIGISDVAWADQNIDGSWTLTFDSPGNYIFDFSAEPATGNFQIFDLSRNRSSFRDPDFYFNGNVNPTLLLGYGSGFETALGLEQGQDRVSSLGSYNSVAVGSLSTANVAYTQMVDGSFGIGGYSITGARGNIATGNIQPVNSKDFLGYVNALMYSGTAGTSNTFQQSASISFFATGSNVAYGLGGNIAFFTADDGGNGISQVTQALGIENDQSVRTYGNLNVAGTSATQGGIINGATYLFTATTSGANSFNANTAVSTVIIDSTGSATIASANVNLPTSPYDRQVIKISAVAPITTANVFAGSGKLVKYVGSNAFTSGNVTVQLTYFSATGTWYRT